MSDWQRGTLQSYQSKGFAERSGFGDRPALLVVDFINGFTDPSSPLGGDFAAEIGHTARLLDVFRAARFPVAYTTIEYAPDLSDGGHFIRKVPSLGILLKGSPLTRVDERLQSQPGDHVLVKKYASAFFGTNLHHILEGSGVDTVVITGCTTSGCVRASAIDALQYGYRTVVVEDAVGDRAVEPHKANLFDIDAKYGDVMPCDAVLAELATLGARQGAGGRANEDFLRWWNATSTVQSTAR
ncbi:MAG: isochorismatase family protein [Chromatiales bacterium]|nr:isochorismatase family protein [Chromatiales bacterium]